MTNVVKRTVTLICVALVCTLVVRLQAADDVTGAWAFVLNTDGGERQSNATFKVDGKTVTGTWAEKTEVKGTFADGVLELSFPLESSEAGAGTLAIKAKLANDELTGSWTFLQYGGTLEATRVAAAAK